MTNGTEAKVDLPTPGYRLLNVSVANVRYRVVDSDSAELGDESEMRFMWDWRLAGDRQFQVIIGARLIGDKTRPEELDVQLVGSFVILGEPKSVNLESFVHTSATAIMFPYLREKVAKFTADGPYGPHWLPLVNVQNLMKNYDYAQSAGAKQLAANPDAAEAAAEEIAGLDVD